MEIFAFKVGVGPNKPQLYLLGLMNGFSYLAFKISVAITDLQYSTVLQSTVELFLVYFKFEPFADLF